MNETKILLRLTVKTEAESDDLWARILHGKDVKDDLENLPGVVKVQILEYGTPYEIDDS